MPTRGRFIHEVAIDYAIAALVTPLAQWLFYGAYATVTRVVLLTILAVTVEDAGRYVTQWLSAVFLAGKPRRSRCSTMLATVGTALLSMLVTYALQVIIYKTAATPVRAGGLTLALYGLTQLRQYWREATFEVSLDFLVSILVNLGGQRLIYGTLASTGTMTTFTAVFLPLAYLRRLSTRLLFSAMLLADRRQPWWHAALEVLCDTLLALLSAYGLQVVWYGAAATLERAGSLTVALYVLAMLRRYVFRRIFEAWRARQYTPQRPLPPGASSVAKPGPPA